MIYHVICKGKYDEWDVLTTENLDEARERAQEEWLPIEERIRKFGARHVPDVVEIRVYEDEDEQLDYDDIPLHWYAVQMDENDNDWDTGSYNLSYARELAMAYEAKRIAVIEMGDDPVCIEEIEVE